jgi:hypothetical protein
VKVGLSKTISRRGPRFLQLAEPRERSGEIEMRHWLIWIGLDAPADPRDRFRVGTEMQFEHADTELPTEGADIARREAERLVDVGLGFPAATEKKLRPTDENMSVCQISIQGQRLLAFGDALGCTVCLDVDDAQS